MNIKTASVTAAVLGTTGFIQVKEKTFVFGLIEGKSRVIINGVTYLVGAGEILRTTGDSAPQVVAYNIPHFLETSPLMTSFHSQLPNQTYINQEVATYNDLVARGFIAPPSGPYFGDVEGAVPTVPTNIPDQAQRAHFVFDMTPSAPMSAKSGPGGFAAKAAELFSRVWARGSLGSSTSACSKWFLACSNLRLRNASIPASCRRRNSSIPGGSPSFFSPSTVKAFTGWLLPFTTTTATLRR